MSTIYDSLDTTVLKKAGDYVLSEISLISYVSGDRSSEPSKVSIQSQVVDLNIYESIFNKTLSGNIVVVDTENVIGNLPLTGNERIEFKLYTPSSSRGFDFTIKSGHPMYVYKISNRTEISPRSQLYTLHFCSKEMITNEQKSVSYASLDTYANMVADMVRDPDLLSTTKNVYYEPSIGLRKHVFNNVKPFDAIDQLALVTQSLKFDNAGYYFYETSSGFNYRSLENMMAVEQNTARPVVGRFLPKPYNIRQGGNKDILSEMQIVSDFRVVSQFDTLKNLRNGVYGSKLITHDQLNKTYEETAFDYHIEYEKNFHTEYGKDGTKTDNQGILPLYVMDGKALSDHPDGTIYLWPNTTNTHYTPQNNPVEAAAYKDILQKRLSQRLAFTTLTINLTVPGYTGIQAGDLINFEMPSYEPANKSDPLDRDPYLSGRYLITSIRHKLDRKKSTHWMILECMKDSVHKASPEENIDTFINKEKMEAGVVDLYELDKRVFNS
jgi:hypothetical protein